MAYKSAPNITLTSAWTAINDGTEANLTVQLLGYSPVIVQIGSAAPTADNMDGHVIRTGGAKDYLTFAGLTGERVYARVPTGAASSVVAITKA